MKNHPLPIVVFLLLFLVPFEGYSQRTPRVEYINIDDGLPQNTVQSITKDAFGFIWFGTDNGLCRYDGYGFDYYYSNGDEDQLLDNRILHLSTNHQDLLYVTTQKGLQILNLLSGKFLKIEQANIHLLFNQDIVQTLHDGENLWLVTKVNGVYKLQETKEGIEVKGRYQSFENASSPLCIYKGVDNAIFLGTVAGLMIHDPISDKFNAYQYNDSTYNPAYIQCLLDDANNLYIGTNNGLFLYKKQAGVIEWLNHDGSNINSLYHSNVTAITKVNNELIIGTLGGLCSLNLDDNQVNRFHLPNYTNEDVHVEFIRSIFTDNQGDVWVGTDKVGLVYYNIHKKAFNALDGFDSDYSVLNRSIINSIYKNEQSLWVGTAGNGLARINQKDSQLKFYQNRINDPNSIESNFITCIYEDRRSNIWVGTWGMGVQMLRKGKGERFVSYHIDKGLPSDFISTFYVNKKGEVLVGTQGGLCIYNEKDDRFYSIQPAGGGAIENWEVGCIQEDKNGFYWVGTTDGLHRFNGKLIKDDEPTVISRYEQVWYKETNEKNSLPDNYITTLNIDAEGTIWIGTYGGGIAKCVETENGNYEFINFNQQDGLANNIVYSLLCDDNNNLWITTENGLSKFNIEAQHFINYYKQDNLRNNQYYWSAGFKDADSNLYVGGLNGLNYFDPDRIKKFPFETKPIVTALKIYNKKVVPGDVHNGVTPLHRASFAVDTISLSHKDNVFSLEFSAMDFLHSSKIKYAYRLDGVDKEWVNVDSKRRVASYTNLAGGVYLFELKSTNDEGVWNDEFTQVYIEIIPPFWQELWFKLLMILIAVLMMAGYIRYRSFRMSMQNKRLEQLVKERTIEINEKNQQLEVSSQRLLDTNEQLEKRSAKIEKQKAQLEEQNSEIRTQRDQLIALNEEVESIHQMRMQFFTNISHEFRTPLTLIISPIQRLLSSGNNQLPEAAQKTIKIVKRNAERLLLLTNQILTFRKLEAGKLQVQLQQGKLDEVIVEIGEAFKVLAEDKHITYLTNVSQADYFGWFDKSKLENILFNLLANAFKYSSESGKVELSLNLEKNSESQKIIEVIVTDNGQGIKPEIQEKVFDRFYRADNNLGFGTGIGLSLVKELVIKLNGQINLSSEYGKGASFKLILPIEKESFDDYTIVEEGVADSVTLNQKVNLIKEAANQGSNQPVNDADKAHVLIVEDNDDLRQFLTESLAENYHVIAAKDGQEGSELALQKEVDLVVSDIMMPRLNGLDLCKQLKNNLNTSHMPIVLLSAKGMEENQLEGLGVGADDYITKPFSFAFLEAKIRSLIDNRQKLKAIYLQNTDAEADLKGSTLDEDFMQKVNHVVSEFYADPTFDIETFASKMFVSRSLLYKKLKALTNVSPNEYINVSRLKKSIPLLKSKKYQVAEVAVMVGFNDPKYFSRVFKKFYKCSPSEYVSV
ncbi:two-component regulator propeller domain-containing protein [Carboxylicivirga sp. N1Y90]|uniref:hybrid sensor histidine kinase/response regulator transcription factor n=1 Tax=Carboxylicivirga fragile TaxID=3417571 RepID=UPI003D340BF9|nr:response regulator [Marinilabiliaceae bacterium N1Y90]